MPSSNVNDYPKFREYAARFGADRALSAKFGVEWRAEQACAAARACMTVGDRARRGRYGEHLEREVLRATSSPGAWAEVAAEADRRFAAAEAERRLRLPWSAPREAIAGRAATRSPAPHIRATITPAPPAAPAPPAPAVVDPLLEHADQLEAEGHVFAARC